MRRRLKACVQEWPECESGLYNPMCCRFPKSCSCDVYDARKVTDDDLEDKVIHDAKLVCEYRDPVTDDDLEDKVIHNAQLINVSLDKEPGPYGGTFQMVEERITTPTYTQVRMNADSSDLREARATIGKLTQEIERLERKVDQLQNTMAYLDILMDEEDKRTRTTSIDNFVLMWIGEVWTNLSYADGQTWKSLKEWVDDTGGFITGKVDQ